MSSEGKTRLNKYIAHSGLCSRRKADELIGKGQVKVNGEVVLEMGYLVAPEDKVTFKGKPVIPERKVYVLLNKPKDFITTTHDERGRKTVMDLVRKAAKVRLYPVGRLDRNTTGLLLLTNDGELAQQLSHPSKEVEKIYYAELDRPLSKADMQSLEKGVRLEDGFIRPDELAFTEAADHRKIGLSIHSGKNRIVRRLFEHLGYRIRKLDRVGYAGLSKKNIPRGKWRYLSKEEVIRLKHFR